MGILRDVLARMAELSSSGMGTRTNAQGEEVCYYCGAPLSDAVSHVDHVAPRSRGGENKAYNLVTTCAQCNVRKNAKHPLEWLSEQELPESIEIDVLARLLFSVWVAWPRRKDESDIKVVAICGEHEGTLILPVGWKLGEIIAQQPCPSCHGHGATIEMPAGVWGLLRCSMCGFTEIVKMSQG